MYEYVFVQCNKVRFRTVVENGDCYNSHMNERVQIAAVETGHRYVLEDVLNPELMQREIALAEKVASVLREEAYGTSKIVLLDETKPEASFETSPENGWRWRLHIEREVSKIKKDIPEQYSVWLESSFEKDALRIIDALKKRLHEGAGAEIGARLSGEGDNRIKIGSNKEGHNITLLQKVVTNSDAVVYMPSCPVLDLAVYEAKLKESDIAVTILPETFKKQQEEVKSLFAILGKVPSVVVVYFNEETNAVSNVDSWNPQQRDLASRLQAVLS